MNEEEFLKRLNEAFAIEAEEHYQAICKGMTVLEQSSTEDPSAVIEAVFRDTHSLKGAARAVNHSGIERLCQQLESLFALLKRNIQLISSIPFALCSEACELLGRMIDEDAENEVHETELESMLTTLKLAVADTENRAAQTKRNYERNIAATKVIENKPGKNNAPDISTHKQSATSAIKEKTFTNSATDADASDKSRPKRIEHAHTGKTSPKTTKDSVRVSLREIDAVYRLAEELSTVRYMLGRTVDDLRIVMELCRDWVSEHHKHRERITENRSKNGKISSSVVAREEEFNRFVAWTSRQIDAIEIIVGNSIEHGRGRMYIMDTMSDALLEQTRQLLLLPFSIITEALPTIVQKLARDLSKRVDFSITGDEVRIDKRILEELKDPLIHLLRNSLDHGIESAEVREKNGKTASGSLQLEIRNTDDNQVVLTLVDDGAGIDVESVRAKAEAEGLMPVDLLNALSEERVLDLIFSSGLSTARSVTELSGRGLGLAVVREKIKSLGGEVTVNSQIGRGTVFTMHLPVSISNARGVIIRTTGRLYAVPLQYIVRGVSLVREELSVLDGRMVFNYEGKTIAAYRLEEILGVPVSVAPPVLYEAMLIITCNDAIFALHVEEILWEQDIVVKPLPEPIARIRMISGATLLGTGELVPVLHIPDILAATKEGTISQSKMAVQEEEEKKNRLLVVDDSITSRVLLHDILVSSGYQVKTAVDGIDALTQLREHEYDLIVSDIEMPRMNGIELTQNIRKDQKLHELPVILVTGLESREDRERGFDAGANAYIIKSGFDQSNLLKAIERLI